jgi:hypothetical protein
MVCPKCKVENRPGFTRCFDCDVALVSVLLEEESPEPDSPGNSHFANFLEIWRGEDEVLHKDLLKHLRDAANLAESKPMREAAGCGQDPAVRGLHPRFGFIVRVHPKDEAQALSILQQILQTGAGDLSISVGRPASSPAMPRVHPPDLAHQPQSEENEEQEWKCVWEGTDGAQRDFVQASLRENDIPSESRFQRHSYRVFVRESAQPKALATVQEIVEGKPPSFEPDESEALAGFVFRDPASQLGHPCVQANSSTHARHRYFWQRLGRLSGSALR